MADGMIKPKTKLKGKSPDLVVAKKAKMIAFGPSGVGKTTLALQFPDVYFIDVEEGATQPEYIEKLKAANGVYFGPDEGAASFDEVLGQIKALATEQHDRRTLVIDSVTKLFANEIAREGERLHDAGKKNEFGADKKPAVSYMRQLCNWIKRIDMNVILIAGEVAEWGLDAKGERVQIGETFDCWPRLEYELDLAVKVLRAGPKRLGRVRKTRIAAFPEAETFPWTYDEFARRYGRENLESAAAPVRVATEEQLMEINGLLALSKLDQETIDKWLAAANVSTWEEMDTDKVAKVIEHLRAKIKGA
jgi:hypothetical protein